MEKSIVLSQAQKELLLAHASKWSPNESCAILFGRIEEGKNIVEEVFLAENTDESPVNFTISNEELLKAYKMAEQKKLDIVGIFHSHPNSDTLPSSTDKKFMLSNPVVWLIYSEDQDEFRAYELNSDIVEIPIVIS